MGHLVDQVEVAAVESQVTKPSATSTTDSAVSSAAVSAVPTVVAATIPTCAVLTTTITTTAAPQVSTVQSSSIQSTVQTAQNVHPSQLRPLTAEQITSKPKQRKLQFKLDDEGSPDKKPKERFEECIEEEESGWWAERVAMALVGITEYRDAWNKSHAHLLHGDGPLPHTWRLYIAALAVCRHEVSWLMQALLADFRNAGGDMRWTIGLHHAPPKLYALSTINNILAHRPWLLSPQHIQQLTKGEDSWSLGELCQALCIMTHFHALSTFLHGCGLSNLNSSPKKEEGPVVTQTGSSGNISPQNGQTRLPCSDLSPRNNNSAVESGCKEKSPRASTKEPVGQSFAHLKVNPTYSYVDSACREDDIRVPSFCVQEYNWQDHGYAMCSRLNGEIGALLEDRFKCALTLRVPINMDVYPETSAKVDQLNNTLCKETQISSTPLSAKTLWNHVQWILGIHRDDCDYTELSKRIDPQIRHFIKTACCFPETLADTKSNPLTTSSVQSCLVEMSVIVMEARLQSELLYGLRAIMQHHC